MAANNNVGHIIVKEGKLKGIIALPSLLYKDNVGNTRIYNMYIRAIHKKSKKDIKKANWELDEKDTIEITEQILGYSPDDILIDLTLKNIIAQIWTDTGIFNPSSNVFITDESKYVRKPGYKNMVSIPTYIESGKNIGKKNETTILQQAISVAKSKYNNKMKGTRSKNIKRLPYPMLLRKYSEGKKGANPIVYPAYVQRKLDGGRFIAYFNNGKAEMYSRALFKININKEIQDQFNELYKRVGTHLYFDGEFYLHGESLQDISGMMRNEKNPQEKDGKKLECHIFDVFRTRDEQNTWTFEERLRTVLIPLIDTTKDLPLIKVVETIEVKDKKEEDKYYEQFLAEGYEGLIIRNKKGIYEYGTTIAKRSYDVRKRKPRHSAEYRVVNYTEGKNGKDKGAIIWILEFRNGKYIYSFNAVPNMTYEERYELYKNMTAEKFAEEYKDKMMTVEYDELSDDGVPLRAKAIGLRLID